MKTTQEVAEVLLGYVLLHTGPVVIPADVIKAGFPENLTIVIRQDDEGIYLSLSNDPAVAESD